MARLCTEPHPKTHERYAHRAGDYPLCWSFVRDDLEREEVCRQLALALRDEVLDPEQAGLKIIQIDEAALREGLPLRKDEAENIYNGPSTPSA